MEPGIQIVDDGDNATFTCSATGTTNVTFLWLRSDLFDISDVSFASLLTDIPVAVDEILEELENFTLDTGPQLDILSVNSSEDGGSYLCIVLNQAGAGMAEGSLYVRVTVLEQPSDVLAAISDMATFTFRAESFPSPSYQWQKYADSGFDSIENETSEMLIFSPVNHDDFGTYRCVATATLANDTVISDNVTLTGMLY